MENKQFGAFRQSVKVEDFVRRAASCLPKVRRTVGRWVGWFGRTDAMGLVLHNNIQYLVSFTTIIYSPQ